MAEAGIPPRMESCAHSSLRVNLLQVCQVQMCQGSNYVLRKYNYTQLTSHISILKREQKYPFLWTMPASCCKTVSKAKKVNSVRSSTAPPNPTTVVDAEFGKGVLVQTTLDCKKRYFNEAFFRIQVVSGMPL